MVEATPASIALISIHPHFADAILEGRKRVEFRKVAFKRTITHVLLYATSPVQQIIGCARVDEIDECSPTELWRRYHEVGGIDRGAFFDYFGGRSLGFALKVREPRRLRRPVRLSELREATAPPQSFKYGTPELFGLVQRVYA